MRSQTKLFFAKTKSTAQRLGNFLSKMIMPVIGAFIAFGLITTIACYLPEGWVKNGFSYVSTAICMYLLPLLIAFLGGRLIYEIKGGVVGAMFTIGLIIAGHYDLAPAYLKPLLAGNNMPMFLGAIIVGPIGGILIKLIDLQVKKITPTGFEMLFSNLAVGIVGLVVATLAYFGISYLIVGITWILGQAVSGLESFHGLALMSIIVEPAKVLFLNNAINHGVFTPLGTAEALKYGRSLLFMVESNPGPGTGLLLAYIMFYRGDNRRNAIGALPIHLLGGIHEIYFPFVIMMPILLLPLIVGGATGVAVGQILGGGLQNPASPGSIIMEYISTPKGPFSSQLPGTVVNWYPGSTYVANTVSMGSAALVTFFGSMICLKFKKTNKSLAETQQEVMTMKNESKGLMPSVNQIIFACDAGMGSSAMGATKLKKLFQQEGIQGIEVIHKSVSEVPADAKIVLVHESLKEQVQKRNKVAHIITIKDFMNAPEYYALAKELKNNQLPSSKKVSNSIAETTKPKMLTFDHILLNQPVESIEKAIKCVGDLLLTNENITAQYIDSMLKRDQDVSVAIGNLIAIPHAINEDRKYIKKNGLAVVTYQKPIDWHGTPVQLVIGIAVNNEDHMGILANICDKLSSEEDVINLIKSNSKERIYQLLTGVTNEN